MSSDSISPLKEIGYGAVSGMIGKLVEFPFDTIKVRLQSSSKFSNQSTFAVIRQTYTNEGIINGFYQGIRAPLLGACLETAILFSAYNTSTSAFINNLTNKNYNIDTLPLWAKCASGGVAGCMASFVLTPVELIKCKLQVLNLSSSINMKNPYTSIIKKILINDGITGLWHGLGSTMVREIGGTAIWFGTYEFMNQEFKKNKMDNDLTLLVSGASAGIAFNLSMFPIDTIKSNIQTHDILQNQTSVKKHNFMDATKTLLARKGSFRNLYNGLNITLIRAIPANALIFYSYEVLKRNF